jgi:hypothetical protein
MEMKRVYFAQDFSRMISMEDMGPVPEIVLLGA